MTLTQPALPKGLFDQQVSPTLLAQAARIFLSNQRRAQARTKTRAGVEGSTRKIFRQKGTGNARHGSRRAPIFVGGGISHGPDGQQNYDKVMPLKMRKLAVVGALTQKAREKAVMIVTGEATGKTKQAKELLKTLDSKLNSRPLVIVDNQPKVKLAWRNVTGAKVRSWTNINAYEVMLAKPVLITEAALEQLKKKYV